MVYSRKIITKIILGAALILLTSCSWIGVREPSAVPKVALVSMDDVFSIESSAEIGKNDFKQYFTDSLGFQGSSDVEYQFVQSTELPDKTAFKLELDVIKDKYTYRFIYSKNAFKDHGAVFELGVLMQKIKNNPVLIHHLSMFEMYYNAKEGDVIALDNFLKIRALKESGFVSPFEEDLTENFLKRVKVYEEMHAELSPQIKELKAQRKALDLSRKNILDKIDKAPEGKQFKALVAKGDRNGVADLLKKYLPFEDMAPFEKRFWETHLEIIRNPVPLDQRVLIYRGLNEDYIASAIEGGGELSRTDAIRDSKAFVMSSLLVKNQGSWNRRLRSLETMNEKFIATIKDSSEYSQSARISTMFFKHAGNPQGSPFISFTPNVGVAETFGQKQLMSALVDPRLIEFNYVSSFNNEVEFLMPLTTFPDDLVGLWTPNAPLAEREFLEDRLKMRISEEFGKAKTEDIIKRIKKNSADFFSTVYGDGQPKITKVTGGTMADFYKKFGKIKGAFKPPMTAKGDLTCKDLLKIFWAVP
ncbi:MAG: hypothetical protein H7281_13210 [Bacteriovorax sp.]|nr:hypothetical protein [Bacteriovorax sp.]